jgi:phosphate transport system permease protein
MGHAVAHAQATAHDTATGPRLGGAIFIVITGVAAVLIGALVIFVVVVLAQGSWPAFQEYGWAFIYGPVWDPTLTPPVFGALPFIYGTLVTSAIGVLIGVPLSLGIAVFLTELSPTSVAVPLGFLVELLAAVPSVVFGLWGFYVLVPIMKEYIDPWLQSFLGWSPLFQGQIYGVGYLTAGVILAIMIIPTVSAIARESLRAVPQNQREAALSLGATSWEKTRVAVLPYARSGIFAAVILGLGRAVGETMAVTMTIGNSNTINHSLLAPGQSIASLIANEWGVTTGIEQNALLYTALILLVITLLINVIARLVLRRFSKGAGPIE